MIGTMHKTDILMLVILGAILGLLAGALVGAGLGALLLLVMGESINTIELVFFAGFGLLIGTPVGAGTAVRAFRKGLGLEWVLIAVSGAALGLVLALWPTLGGLASSVSQFALLLVMAGLIGWAVAQMTARLVAGLSGVGLAGRWTWAVYLMTFVLVTATLAVGIRFLLALFVF